MRGLFYYLILFFRPYSVRVTNPLHFGELPTGWTEYYRKIPVTLYSTIYTTEQQYSWYTLYVKHGIPLEGIYLGPVLVKEE